MRKHLLSKGGKKFMAAGLIAILAVGMTACGSADVNGTGSGKDDGNNKVEATVNAASKYNNDFASTGITNYKKISSSVFKGQPQYTTTDEHFWYSVYENAVLVYYIGGLGDTVAYPCEFDGKPVRGIGMDYALNNDSNKSEYMEESKHADVKNVVIPETVWCIDTYAFKGFKSLTSVDIPEGVVHIGAGCFEQCDTLTEITLPASVLYVGSQMIYEADNVAVVYAKNMNMIQPNDVFTAAKKGVKEFTHIQ